MHPLRQSLSGPRLYARYALCSLRSQAQYPGSALLLTLGHFLGTGLEVLSVLALFERFGNVRGWPLGQVLLFYALVNIQFACADLLSRGFDVLGSQLIRSGGFDRLLLRPRSLILQLLGHEVRLSRLGRLLQASLVLWVATERAPLDWSLGNVAVFAFAVAGGCALFVGLFMLQGTLSFWTIESLEVANVLTYGGVQAAQYPLSLYPRWLSLLLIGAVPLGCVAYYPALAILGREDALGLPQAWHAAMPSCGFAFLGLACLGWRRGVRRYTSTGS